MLWVICSASRSKRSDTVCPRCIQVDGVQLLAGKIPGKKQLPEHVDDIGDKPFRRNRFVVDVGVAGLILTVVDNPLGDIGQFQGGPAHDIRLRSGTHHRRRNASYSWDRSRSQAVWLPVKIDKRWRQSGRCNWIATLEHQMALSARLELKLTIKAKACQKPSLRHGFAARAI